MIGSLYVIFVSTSVGHLPPGIHFVHSSCMWDNLSLPVVRTYYSICGHNAVRNVQETTIILSDIAIRHHYTLLLPSPEEGISVYSETCWEPAIKLNFWPGLQPHETNLEFMSCRVMDLYLYGYFD